MKIAYVDLETTGVDPNRHGIWSIAMIVEFDGEEVGRFYEKAQPIRGRAISSKALEIGGIDRDTLEGFQPPTSAYALLAAFLQQFVAKFKKEDKLWFVAYNAAVFDYPFLRGWFEQMKDTYFGNWFYHPPICTMVLAGKILMPIRKQMKNFRLATVCEQFDIPVDEEKTHDALYDVELCRELYKKIDPLILPF